MSPPPASLHSPAAVPRSPSRNSLLECGSQKEVTFKVRPSRSTRQPRWRSRPLTAGAPFRKSPSAFTRRDRRAPLGVKIEEMVRSGAAGRFSWGEPQINKAAAVNPFVIFGTLNWWRCAVAVLPQRRPAWCLRLCIVAWRLCPVNTRGSEKPSSAELHRDM